MSPSIVQPEIQEMVEAKDFATLKAALCEMEEHDLAELLSELEENELAVCFRLLPTELAAEILGDFEPQQQEDLLTTLRAEKLTAILNEMPPDDRTELLEEMPGELAQRLMNLLRGQEREIADRLLAYPEDSIGRLMTPEYVAVRADWTVETVFRHIRKVAPAKETVNVIYVVDRQWKLQDEVRLDELVLADPANTVEDILDHQVAYLVAGEDREVAIEMFRKYDAVALPVVNRQGILVGIVTHDDAMDVAEEEDTEDFQLMAGMAALGDSYFGTSWLGMIRKRLPWLALLLLAETLAVMVLMKYEASLAVLAMFMPLINATAGNTGNQVAGLMIRGFAVREVEMGDWLRVLLRELGRGMAMGVFLAAVAAGIVMGFGRGLPTALAAGVAMVIAVTMANLLGAMLPFFFRRVGVDPAVTSGPFIACLMDVTSILIFFSVATVTLGQLG